MNRLIRRPTARRATGATFFVSLFLLLSSAADAQTATSTHATDGHTPLEIAPGSPAGSYALGDFDNISLFSQSLGFRLPLLKVGGRGGASYTVTLPIERKWRVKHTVYDPSGGDGQTVPEHHYLPIESWYTALKPGFSPGVMVVRQSGIDPSRVKNGCTGYYNRTLTRLTFVAPDGTEYELRDALFGGEPRPRGTSSCDEGANRGRVFVTSDGSSATFVAEADVIDYTLQREDPEQIIIPVSGTLYLRDGTRYHISGNFVDLIRDRNGNEVRLQSAEAQPGVFAQKAVDSIGREVIFNNNEITYRGFGGAPRTISVLYAPLEDRLRQATPGHPAETIKSRGELFPHLPFNNQDVGFTGPPFNDSVVSEVVLPDGRRYGFRYNSYGELARVELPTGGAFEYDYAGGGFGQGALGGGVFTDGTEYEIFRQVVAKRVYDEGGQLVGVTNFGACAAGSVNPPDSCVQVDQYDPNPTASSCEQQAGTGYRLISRTRHYFRGTAGPGLFARPTQYTKWDEGKEYRTESYACDGVTLLRRVEQEWRQKGAVGWWVNYSPVNERGEEPSNDPRMVQTVTTLADSGQVSKTSSINPSDGSVGFDRYNNPTDVWEYDYGQGQPGALLRHTHNDYLTTNTADGVTYDYACDPATTCSYQSLVSNPNVIHLRGLPLQMSVYEVRAGLPEVERSRARYEYDDYSTGNGHAALTSRSDIFGLCLVRSNDNCLTPSSNTYLTRGNVTATTSYLLDNNGAVTGAVASYAQYDVVGNAVKAVDPLGRETSFDFDDNFGTPDGEVRTNTVPSELSQQSPQAHAYALPKSVTDAAGYTSYAQYDYYLGRAVDGEDINDTHTLLRYDDALDRLTRGVRAFGTAEQNQTTITYNDAARTITATSDLNAYNDNLLKAETVYDGLGRTVKSRKYEDAAQYILSEQKYDAAGRAFQASNPYRPTLGESPVWTTTAYDALGRVTSVTTPDGATVYTLYDGPRTLVSDQAKRQRIGKTDALGRLTDVWEVRSADAASGTEQVTFPVPPGGPVPAVSDGYRTAYSYDVLGNLRTVSQGAQTRTFVYDSLSRLTSAVNPEGGTVEYRYDALGNLVLKIDPRPRTGGTTLLNCPVPYTGGQVATCYEYDVLNRIKSRKYNDGTPDVAYAYDDPSVANSKGHLTSVVSSVSAYSYGAFDVHGRVKSSSQTTGGTTYSMPEYKYDLAGNLTSEKYPSGRVVETKYDTAGRVAGVKNPATGLYYAGAVPTDSTNRIQYTAAGAASSVRLGNGLWEHTLYNSRLQPTQIGLGTSAADSSVLKLDYGYGEVVGGTLDANGEVVGGTLDITRNNGNVRSQTITAQGLAPLMQSYRYDELNRLKWAGEKSGTSPTWRQVFSYDRYGNRNFAAGTTSPDYSQTPNDPSTGLPTDFVRNPVFDALNNRIKVTAAGQSAYRYDAAGNLLCEPGRQCAQGQSSVTPHYDYDADNRMKSAGGGYEGGGTTYTYDGDGNRIRKSTSNGKDTVFVYDAMGRAVAEYSNHVEYKGTRYLTQDHLGSTRVVIDAQGNAHSNNGASGSRLDYFPFGEETPADSNWRTTARGYGSGDGVRQKFTGYERDNEVNLDFAQNRYYSFSHGRFTSVDPVMASADITNPQTFNRYTYAGNNPINITDPTGTIWAISGSNVQWFGDKAAMEAAGFQPYNALVGMVNGGLVALNPNAGTYQSVANAAEALKVIAAMGAGAGAIEATAGALGVPGALALAYVAAIHYNGPPDATMDDCISCGRYIQNYVNMMNKRADDLAAQVNQSSSVRGESSTANPNPDDPNKPTQPPPLRHAHRLKESTLQHIRKWSTDRILDSLRPGNNSPLTTKPDGTIMQGNHRIQVLRERGVNVDALPREIHNPITYDHP